MNMLQVAKAEPVAPARNMCEPRPSGIAIKKRAPVEGPVKPRWNNAVSMLVELACMSDERVAFRFLDDSLHEISKRSARDLFANASAICDQLNARYAAGSRLVLAYAPGLEFIDAFFGCLMAGMIAVPLPLPKRRRVDERLSAVLVDCAPSACLTARHDHSVVAESLESLDNRLELLDTDTFLGNARFEVNWVPSPDQIAHIQYTSGSTGRPRGAVISHRNLMTNLEMIRRGFDFGAFEHLVSWLPHYHDMGLVGDTLSPLYSQVPCTRMAPQSFMRRPLAWLQAATQYRATVIGAPNFAYDLCARAASPESIRSLDLHCLKIAYCGAEQVHPETAQRFQAAFEPAGFHPDAFRPCYGLTEATLCVTVGRRLSPLKIRNRPALGSGSSHDCRPVVGCGRPIQGCRVQIVDQQSDTSLPDREIGEIVLAGPSVSPGYWGDIDVLNGQLLGNETSASIRTGDLGFLESGELYVTGRKKDLIIIGGCNLYPQDLERTAMAAHDAVQGCVAFAVDSDEWEKIVLIAEVSREFRNGDLHPVRMAVQKAVLENHEVSIGELLLVRPLSIPRTSSGKIRRLAAREQYINQQIQGILEDHSKSPSSASSDSAHCEFVTNYLRRWVFRNLGIEPTSITSASRLSDFGLDSLRAVELQLSLARDCGLTVSPGAFVDGVSIAELARRASRFVVPAEPPLAVLPAQETVELSFNVMPGRFVQETLFTREYRIWKGYAEAVFDRNYRSEMIASPDHLVFLTALTHTQKLAYVYMSHELGFTHQPNAREKFKFWPTDVRVTMPQMVTDTTGLRQQLWAYDQRLVSENKFEVKCRSLIGSMEIMIDSTMLLLGAK